MRAPSLALSAPLYRWLAQDPQWSALPLRWRAMAGWQAGWGSFNSGLSRAIAAQAGPVELKDPLLILGPWRSGTTVMHELLTAASGSATPLTWQCMNACAFQLNRKGPAGPAAAARPMDGLEVRNDSPQEDEFALLTLGAPSAYRAFWMPHRIHELHATLEQEYWLANPQWLQHWESFLRGVLRATPDARQPLLLKSPNHTFRVQSILKRFPRSQLVWVARDPSDVFHSNRKMWLQMFATHGVTAPEPAALDRFLIDAFERTADALAWCDTHLPIEQLVVVRHDELLADPEAVVQAVWRRLADGRPSLAAQLREAVQRTRRGRVETYASTIPANALPAVSALAAAQDRAAMRRGVVEGAER